MGEEMNMTKLICLLIGYGMWIWAIVEKNNFGIVKAMILIALIYVIDSNAKLTKIEKEVSK